MNENATVHEIIALRRVQNDVCLLSGPYNVHRLGGGGHESLANYLVIDDTRSLYMSEPILTHNAPTANKAEDHLSGSLSRSLASFAIHEEVL